MLSNLKKAIFKEKPFFWVIPAFLWQILFFYLPLLFILFLSFSRFSEGIIYHGFTLKNYSLFFNFTYFKVLINSLFLALVTSILCLLIGYPIAYYISFKSRIKNLLIFLIIIPFWTNFLLHIFAWFFVLDRYGIVNLLLLKLNLIKEPLMLQNNMFSIILVMVYSYLPFMVLPIYSILEKFNRNLIESSLDLGASMGQTLLKVILPLTLPGIVSGLFLVFIPSFGEYAIPSLMGGERYVFIGNVIYNYILGNRTMEVGAAFTVLSIFSLIVSLAIIYLIIKKFWKVKLI